MKITRWMLALAVSVRFASSATAQEEVPFITTPDRVTLAMLELAGVKRGDHVIDLGSGDGRIVITAARRFGATGLGVEIDPALVERSRANALRAGVAERAVFKEQDLFTTDLSRATVITLYLLPEINLQLRPALLALKPGTRIVSHDWDMGQWRPERSLTLEVPEKTIGLEKRSHVYLWVVPAQVQGLWCGANGSALDLTQTFQQARGRIVHARGTSPAWGQVHADTLRLATQEARLHLRHYPQGLRVIGASGNWAHWQGRRFTPAKGAHCEA